MYHAIFEGKMCFMIVEILVIYHILMHTVSKSRRAN